MRLPMKYSDRLVAPARLQFSEIFGTCPAVAALFKALVQVVIFGLFSGQLKSVLHYPEQRCLLSNIV